MNKEYRNLEEFNKDFFKSKTTIKAFGNSGVMKLNDDVQAKLNLIHTSIMNQYDAIEVVIIHKINGVLDRQVFSFNDYFSTQDRIDNRLNDISTNFYVTTTTNSWYICKPSDEAISKFIKHLIDYTKFYR